MTGLAIVLLTVGMMFGMTVERKATKAEKAKTETVGVKLADGITTGE